MWLLRFLFAPELGRALGETRGAARRFGANVRALTEGVPDGTWRWRRVLERDRRPRALLGAGLTALGGGLMALGASGLVAGPATAQTIDPRIFAVTDNATRDLLGFLSDVDVARHAVLGDMLFVFNGGVLLLAGFLLLWHTVAGVVDTARTGRWGFGAWEVVRIVVAVGPHGAATGRHERRPARGGGPRRPRRRFRGRGLDPLLGAGAGAAAIPSRPRPKAAAWRSAISRVLLAETCAHVANANAVRVGDDPYIEVNDERIEGALLLHYDGDGRGMPRDLCGAVRFDGLDGEGSRGIAARTGIAAPWKGCFRPSAASPPNWATGTCRARRSTATLCPTWRPPWTRAASPSPTRPCWTRPWAVPPRRSASPSRRAVAEDAAGSSWLAAAGFFNTIASRTGLFQAAAHNVPDAALPLPSLEEWSPPAAAAVKGLLGALASSRTWQPVFFSAGAGVSGTLPAVGGGDGGLVAGLFEFIDLDAAVVADSGNPIADLAGFGHDLIASALGAIGAISGVAVGSGLLESIPFFGKGLDAFESVWRVTDGFVSTILGLMLIAGAVLAFVLPALPFIRFLFGVFGWLVNVVEAVLAVTVFAAAHVTRGQDRGLMVPATRQGWLFLPGLFLRPPLMLFGLILGYFVFLAAIGLLNAIWLPQLRDAGASDGLGPIGFLAMLTLYVMICYALMNGAFKLIDLLPSAVLEWIGARADGGDDGAARLAGAVTGGIARAGSGRMTGRIRGGSGG